MIRILKIGAYAALGILLACICFEFILRAIDPTDYTTVMNDPSSGLLIYRPLSSITTESGSCYENTSVINSMGFHGPDVAQAKPAQVFRIVVVGASFVEALQVPTADMFTTILENELNADPARTVTYQVIPIAFSGNGTFLDALYYQRFGEPLKPDLVIELETGNELVHDASRDPNTPQFDAAGNVVLQLPASSRAADTIALKEVVRESKLVILLHAQYTYLMTRLRALFSSPGFFLGSGAASTVPSASDANVTADTADTAPVTLDDSLWPVEEKVTDAFAALVKHDGAQFMIASWTSATVASSTAQELPVRLGGIASRGGFAYTDMVPAMSAQEAATGLDLIIPCDGHWSAAGHQAAANTLYAYLQAHPSLIGK